jgi:hypothetical protein
LEGAFFFFEHNKKNETCHHSNLAILFVTRHIGREKAGVNPINPLKKKNGKKEERSTYMYTEII